MSKKIKILPEFITNKIAAGEVVQRPESVVKELLENAIDANAAKVELIVKGAGKTLIQVVDNGDGMSEEDAMLSIQRHATSKISDYKDIEELRTFGFRGEALSSISSVSKLEIRTETPDDELGTLIRVEDGEVIKEKGSYPKGTSIAVKNLFYNTPARRNFLKTNATELKHIVETFKREALSHPEIEFLLWNNEDLIYELSPGNLEERVKALFGDETLSSIIEVSEPTDYISVSGYIAKPTYNKKNKGDQYLFINKRYVQNKTVNHAVFSAYENILEKGEYPFFILFLDIDPANVDINVHPSKLEVKFDDENSIYTFVKAVAKKSIGSYDLVPSVTFGDESERGEKLSFTSYKRTERNDFSDRPDLQERKPLKVTKRKPSLSDDDIDQLFNSIGPEVKKSAPKEPVVHPFEQQKMTEVEHEKIQGEEVDSSFIVLLHNKYIITQIKSGLMIIDAHVAHERILYEQIMEAFSSDMPTSQQLLFSQTLQVDAGDYALLKELEPHLSKVGFDIKFFGKNTIVIDGAPSDVKLGSEVDMLRDMLDEYKKNQREKDLEVRDNLAKSFSCKAAIKAGDKLDVKEMRILVDQLFATSMPYVCPHGRPIIIKIPLSELDKRFGRTS